MAVVEAQGRDARDVATEYRALGAPLLFVIEGEQVTVWKIHHQLLPAVHRQAWLNQIRGLFEENRNDWAPQRIQNAKTFSLLARAPVGFRRYRFAHRYRG